ncbi:MAG TPA: Eco57I restriction-modification methylase domain-containing protein [Candidatus Hypogeohydataceae bacterium YC41]
MKKQTKLTEKATRIPDTRPAKWVESIQKYLLDVEPMKGEPTRSMRFGMLMQDLFGFQPGFLESYVSGIEKYLKVKQKDRILKGRADNLFGNVIIEFEANIPKKLEEAKEQLRRYIAILWSQEPIEARTPYLCIATDGVRFITYTPTLTKTALKEVSPEDVHLHHVLEEADWTKLKPDGVYYWLDRYFLRKEILHPTSETIVHDFGPKSHAFQTTTNALLTLWQEIKAHSDYAVIYDSWEKYLQIAYGSEVAGDELFVRHTYLATLAKLMAWMRISESNSLPNDAQIVEMLEGRLFKSQGIENFIEEDFFSWLARQEATKVGVGVARWLFSLLQNYNLRELSEDVLKSLYQELVDPETRHDLGEFYTPDWLAHRIINKLLDVNPKGAMLDPACGSGTFLYLAIKEKKERLGKSLETLSHILDSVYGADIHPLAVIVAKTNYILALGDLLLLKGRKGPVTIPIYLADTLKLPEQIITGAEYVITLESRDIYVHTLLLESLGLYDQAIELAKVFAQENKGKSITFEAFRNFLIAQHFPRASNDLLLAALFKIVKELKHFIDTNRDTIWAFVLKNIYKPLFFKRKFDFVIGNPPWIVLRSTEPAYQTFLKWQITKHYRLLTEREHLITHLEVATLFLVRSADLYLKTGGVIAFVLPRSIFSADQHDGLRKRFFRLSEEEGQNLSWREIWDCEYVTPLFNVPASVVIAEKCKTETIKYPIPGQLLSGRLERKNASIAEAEKALSVNNVEFSLHTRGRRSFWSVEKETGAHKASFYKARFAQGATIVPRSFWFVQVKPSPLGFNPDLPPLETADRAMEEAKEAYKGVCFKDTVESRFLYATLLSTDLLPFGHLDYRTIVLPIEAQGDHYKLIDVDGARQRGFLNLSRWLERVEGEWTKRRSSKAERITALGWLDYRRKLTSQNPQARYRVIYNTSGTFLTAAIVENEPVKFEINGQQIAGHGFVADTKTYFCELSNKQEAFFLVAILNAPLIDKLIKPMQSRGLWGPRDIHKKVLELPIPQFSSENASHLRLAELGKECTAKVKGWLESGEAGRIKSIGKLRSMVRELLKEELEEIDGLVEGILE